MTGKIIRNYLDKRGVLGIVRGSFAAPALDGIAVIPAYDEADSLPETLDSLPRTPECGALVVANYPRNAAPEKVAAHHRTVAMLEARRIPFIDAPGIEGGVGEARKLGLDAALGYLKPGGVLFSLDADTLVEAGYFSEVFAYFAKYPAAGGVVLDFAHRPAANAAEQTAIDRYERYLRDFAAELARIGSPYAYWSIGSAFAVRGEAYARCGGMRVRTATEDFYFLQALRKTTEIGLVRTTAVHPSARLSHRVPVGTGPRIAALAAGGVLELPERRFFDEIGALYRAVEAMPETLQQAELPDPVRRFLDDEKFFASWPRMLANTPRDRAKQLQAFHSWFDGLKIIRFLHRRAAEERIPSR